MGGHGQQWMPFWPPLSPADKPEFDLTQGQYKHINFYIDFLNLIKPFNSSLGKYMFKTARPSGSVDSSNPCCCRGKRLHHHGDGVC
jgi:hypothetical protein